MWITGFSFLTPLARKRRARSAAAGQMRRPVLLMEQLEDRTVPASLSYFSTSLNAVIYATAVDSAGDLYVTGSAGSSLPATPGAFKTSGSGAFVAKFSPTGALDYATYLGTSANPDDGGTGIALDGSGDAYVIGQTNGVPTTANAIASSGTIFVAELNPTGSELVYATYIPGTVGAAITFGFAEAIALDGSGNIYVAGAAGAGLPVTANAFQTTYLAGGGSSDAYFMKIDPALSGSASVLYASYLGGSTEDQASSIAVDSAGNAYLEGWAGSSNFPTTSGAFQTTNDSVWGAAFVAKFDPALAGAASLVYSTYLGSNGSHTGAGYVSNADEGDADEIPGSIAVDSAGNAYVTSATISTNFPTTAGAYQTTSNLGGSLNQSNGIYPSDVFVTKLNATGSALVYSTYLGGGMIGSYGTSSGGAGIALDANDDAYVTGWTDSTSFPTVNPVQASNSGGFNAFVTELNPAGSGLLFSTYLGGSSPEYYGYGIGLDSAGNVYAGGAIAAGTTYNPGSGVAAKISLAPSPSFAVAGFPSTTTAGVPQTFTVTALTANGSVNTGYSGTVHFTSSDPQAVLPANYTFTAADQGVYSFTATLKTAGTQSITVTDTTTGSITGIESGIAVTPAAAAKFVLSAPTSVKPGAKFSLTLTVQDAYGNVATGYTGTVQFTSSDSSATLPAKYTFTAADAGVHTFTNKAVLNKKGTQTITVTDTANSALTVTVSIDVT